MKRNLDTIYYHDESDKVVDFAIEKRVIDDRYQYERKSLWYQLWAFITYRILVIPIVFIYKVLFCSVHLKNRKAIRKVKSSYFVYGNHTNQIWDAFTPTLISYPKKPFVIVDADNVSMPFLRYFTKMWGALPLPETYQAAKNFSHTLDHRVAKKSPIFIYPEVHLWPYYTKIRPFKDQTFHYPVKYNMPIFTFTTTYHKRKFAKKPRLDIYIDGPFYPDQSLDPKAAEAKLRDQAYQAMCQRAQLSDYEYVTYIKRSEND